MSERRQAPDDADSGTPSPAAGPRERLVATAVAEIEAHGLTVGLDHISLERVIKASGVSRATAYRHWPHKADFLAEVLIATVRATTLEPETAEELADLRALLEQRRADLLADTGRRDVVVEGLRRTAEGDYRRVLASPQWRTYLALHATCRGLPEGSLRDQVAAELARTEDRFTRHRAEVLGRLVGVMGYRLVPPLAGETGLRVLGEAAGAMMRGLVTTAAADLAGAGGPGETLRVAPFGSTAEADWSRPALHLVGVIVSHIEPDPEVSWDDDRLAALDRLLGEGLAVPNPDAPS